MARQMDPLPGTAARLFQGPNLGFLATLMPDGSPQVTPVWVDYDGKHVLINTAEGRAKIRNVRRDPRVAVTVVHRYLPFLFAMVRGRVVRVTSKGAGTHAGKLARRYLRVPLYSLLVPFGVGGKRVILKVKPEKVVISDPLRLGLPR